MGGEAAVPIPSRGLGSHDAAALTTSEASRFVCVSYLFLRDTVYKLVLELVATTESLQARR